MGRRKPFSNFNSIGVAYVSGGQTGITFTITSALPDLTLTITANDLLTDGVSVA